MRPIYKELIDMWNAKNLDLPLLEGFYWIDKQIIKAFDTSGEIHKLYRITVNDDLSIQCKKYPQKRDFQPESWKETAMRIKPAFESKVFKSVSLIQNTIDKYSDYEKFILTSTGKDSVVTMHLCQLSKIKNVKTVFNNTTLDCADTYKIVNQHKNDWIITTPDIGFYQYIKQENYIPTRFSRGCCSIFKEGNHIQHFNNVDKAIWIMGVRNDESIKRSDRKDVDHNPKWGDRKWMSLNPIREWTELEVWLYIIDNDLPINPKYKKGYKRCGCHIACPYQTKSDWVLDQYFYPTMYNRWHKILEDNFIKNAKWCTLNCTIDEYHKFWNSGVVREQPTKEVIQEFMQYMNITDFSLAEKYFNKECKRCGRIIRQKDVIAMNLKMRSREREDFYCKKCFMEQTGISRTEWNEFVDGFKSEGCVLF